MEAKSSHVAQNDIKCLLSIDCFHCVLLQAEATGTRTVWSALQMEAQPVTQGIGSRLTTTAAARRNPARSRLWSEPRSRWSRKKKVEFSCARALRMPLWDRPMDCPKAQVCVSLPSILKGPCRCRPWCVEVWVRWSALHLVQPHYPGSAVQGLSTSTSPKTTSTQTCPPSLCHYTTRLVGRAHARLPPPRPQPFTPPTPTRGPTWTSIQPTPWQATLWSTSMTQRASGATAPPPAQAPHTMIWPLTSAYRQSRPPDIKAPLSLSPMAANTHLTRTVGLQSHSLSWLAPFQDETIVTPVHPVGLFFHHTDQFWSNSQLLLHYRAT